jgi:outer membrane protein assembly factor BamB
MRTTLHRVQTLAVALPLLCAVAASAEDWPQWRGPNRDSVWHETGILQSFPADGLKIRWRQPVSWGYSSPIVAAGRVFVTDAQLLKSSATERIHCFDETSGKPLWTYPYEVKYPDWAFVPGQSGGPCATPIVEAGRLYAIGANGHVHCLDAQKGTLIWENDPRKKYEVPDWTCRASPLIDGNLLILFAGAKPGACVIALDKKTGKEIWKALSEPVSNSSPLVISPGGKRQLIVWTDESLTSLNPATGETWWREPMETSNNDAIPTPVFQKNRLLIGGLMLELKTDRPAASILWPDSKEAANRTLSNTSTALLLDDAVYSAKSSGELVCLDARTGKQLWETNTITHLKNGASIHITPTQSDGAALLFTEKGDLIRAQLTPNAYREISRAHLLEPTTPFGGRKCAWTPPAYANGHVFARSEQELVCASLIPTP